MLGVLFGGSSKMFLHMGHDGYYAGEMAAGQTLLQVRDVAGLHVTGIYITIEGKENTSFSVTRTRSVRGSDGKMKSESYKETVSEKRVFLSKRYQIFSSTALFLPGDYAFPFTFPIDHDLPGSCDLTDSIPGCKGVVARISYRVTGVVEVAGLFSRSPSDSMDLWVRSKSVPPTKPISMDADQKVTFLCCLSRGQTSLKALVDRNLCTAGQDVSIKLAINNGDCRVDLPKISLKLVATVKLRAKRECYNAGGTVAVVSTAGIRAGEVLERMLSLSVPEKLTSTTNYPLINLSYTLMVVMEVPWSPNVRIPIPMYLSSRPREIVQVALPFVLGPSVQTQPVVNLATMQPCPEYTEGDSSMSKIPTTPVGNASSVPIKAG